MVTNCNGFYFVVPGDTCAGIAQVKGVTTAQLIAWNPAVGAQCTAMWANAYLCVSVIGGTTTTRTTTTTTSTGNGIATPTPTQPGMVSNCKKFAFVNPGDTCEVIARANGVSTADFISWNTGVGGAACTGMWANVYVCVGV
jgi:LysM repeat protein